MSLSVGVACHIDTLSYTLSYTLPLGGLGRVLHVFCDLRGTCGELVVFSFLLATAIGFSSSSLSSSISSSDHLELIPLYKITNLSFLYTIQTFLLHSSSGETHTC